MIFSNIHSEIIENIETTKILTDTKTLKKVIKNIYLLFVLFLLGNISFTVHAEPRVQDYGKELVIVIDPGHGGVNEGTIENGFQEKTMNLVTAQAMYDELMQYDNVTVYMTRTDDKDLSLKQRAKFAESVDADFMFSLHYNASANHTLYGTEIWISAQPPYHAYGYQFGYCYLQEMQEKGLFNRGVKTKLNDEGTDYYGVIRESVKRDIPTVIIEHCHVDQPNDVPFCETEEDWISLGKADALAVAKYFGLSSSSLGVDYSTDSMQLPYVIEDEFVQSTYRDKTPPDICNIKRSNANYDTGEVIVTVTANDYDSPLLYYDYSLDGGETYVPMLPWPGTDLFTGTSPETFTLTLQIPSGMQPEIIVRAYNFADLFIESNPLRSFKEFCYGEDRPKEDMTNSISDDDVITVASEETHPFSFDLLTILTICLVLMIFVFLFVLVLQSIKNHRRRKRRRQRIKELEEQINQQQ